MTQPQHLVALADANRIRLARAALKRAIKKGEVRVSEVLLSEIPDWLETMPVEALCLASPRVGKYRVYPVLHQVPTHPHSHVGFLTIRQRWVLAELSEKWPAVQAQKAVAA
jgi:hypothetical protein